jgi:hypothetical protein
MSRSSTKPREARPPASPLGNQCWIDVFDQTTFQGDMHRLAGPADIAVGKKGYDVASLIIGPAAAVIAIGNCGGGSVADGKMLFQFRPRQIVDDFKKIKGAKQIEWLRILELPT